MSSFSDSVAIRKHYLYEKKNKRLKTLVSEVLKVNNKILQHKICYNIYSLIQNIVNDFGLLYIN